MSVTSVFLSHSSEDKAFVRRLAGDLRRAGVRVWLDEAELKVGDSLLDRITEGIVEMQFLAAVLSTHSVQSGWVRHELKVAMNREIKGSQVRVLPLLLEDCTIPEYLVDKKYADFRDPGAYEQSLEFLLRSVGIDTAKVPTDQRTLFTALNAAMDAANEDRFRRALIGFFNLESGSAPGVVADVLGSISTWSRRSPMRHVEQLVYETVRDCLTGGEAEGVAAARYLQLLHAYLPGPVSRLANDVSSPVLATRLAANLLVYSSGSYGNSDDAERVAEAPDEALALRVVALYTLGEAGHHHACRTLTRVAANATKETPEIHRATYDALGRTSRKTSPSETLQGLAHLIACESVARDLRIDAARRFLEIEPGLVDSARKQWWDTRVAALDLTSH